MDNSPFFLVTDFPPTSRELRKTHYSGKQLCSNLPADILEVNLC